MAKRGAPRGNKNALKSGLYSKRFWPEEISDLIKDEKRDPLENELYLLKILIKRLWAILNRGEISTEDMLKSVNALSVTVLRQAQVMKIARELANEGSREDVIFQILNELENENRQPD